MFEIMNDGVNVIMIHGRLKKEVKNSGEVDFIGKCFNVEIKK